MKNIATILLSLLLCGLPTQQQDSVKVVVTNAHITGTSGIITLTKTTSLKMTGNSSIKGNVQIKINN